MHRRFSAQLVLDWDAKPRPRMVAISECQKRVGETHHHARISDAMVDRIRELHERFGMGYRTIARALQLPVNTVRKIYTYERRATTAVRWKRG